MGTPTRCISLKTLVKTSKRKLNQNRNHYCYVRGANTAVSSLNSTAAVEMSLALPNYHFPDRNQSAATAEPC